MNKFWFYAFWPPLTAINCSAMAWFSWLSGKNNNWLVFIALVIVNILPFWFFISKYSRNLIFDQLLYYIIMMGSYLLTISYLDADKLSLTMLMGMIIAFVGFILLRWPIPEKQPPE